MEVLEWFMITLLIFIFAGADVSVGRFQPGVRLGWRRGGYSVMEEGGRRGEGGREGGKYLDSF